MRTFLAIPVPVAVQGIIEQKQQQLEALLATARLQRTIRWTPPAAVHLTLRFLGETSDQQCREIGSRLAYVALQQGPLSLTLREVGCFPDLRAPTIVWLGLQATGGTLMQLQQAVEEAAQAVGFPAERKPFRPHLTIGRMGRQVAPPQLRAIGQLFTQHPTTTAPPPQADGAFVADHMVHLQSQLQPAGPVYTPLQTFKFTLG